MDQVDERGTSEIRVGRAITIDTDDSGWTKVSAWRRVYRDIAKNHYKTSDLGLALRILAVS